MGFKGSGTPYTIEEVERSAYTILWSPEDHRYVYDGWMPVVSYTCDEFGAYWAIDQSWAWGPDLSGSIGGAGGIGGLAISREHGDGDVGAMFPVYDGNGNLTRMYKVTSGTGGSVGIAEVARYEYGPFGELKGLFGSHAQTNPFRFSTKFTDAETGLVYYGYRYYSPSMGRWLNRDPIGERGDLHLYSWLRSDALNMLDFLGLKSYKKGKDDPIITHDVGAGKHDSITPNGVDQSFYNLLDRTVIPGARNDFGYTDAADHLEHYLKNTGDPYVIKLQKMIDESDSAKLLYEEEKRQAKQFAQSLPVGTHDITSSAPSGGYNAMSENQNWFFAVGGYSSWGRGKVTATCGSDGSTEYSMEFTYKFKDKYNWDTGKSVTILGVVITDKKMGSLHLTGLAQEFEMTGEITETIKWTKAATPASPGTTPSPAPAKKRR